VHAGIGGAKAVVMVDLWKLFVFTLRVGFYFQRKHCSLTILVFYPTELENITLCTCKEPPLQLLSMGLFPCAPLLPSLAVDMQMLEFAQGLFRNAAPNTTAWCETLEEFLGSRNFKLQTRVGVLLRLPE